VSRHEGRMVVTTRTSTLPSALKNNSSPCRTGASKQDKASETATRINRRTIGRNPRTMLFMITSIPTGRAGSLPMVPESRDAPFKMLGSKRLDESGLLEETCGVAG
jgi:hypothetical protein